MANKWWIHGNVVKTQKHKVDHGGRRKGLVISGIISVHTLIEHHFIMLYWVAIIRV
jgi:hypothetical protein